MAVSNSVTEGYFSPELRADLTQWAECVTGAIPLEEYVGMIQAAGFQDIYVLDKVDTEGIIERQDGMPRIFSARITATKP
jgi:hypothetical protein